MKAAPCRRDPCSGFTLMEAVIALSILAVGLLAMLGMQLQAVRQADWGRHTTDAGRVARDQLEMFSRLDWADADLQDTNWTAAVAVNSDVESPEGTYTEQVFNLQWRITTDPANTNLRQIDVRVLWDEGDVAGVGDQRRYAVSSIRYND
jgi:type IV pilus assembly protein PilV